MSRVTGIMPISAVTATFTQPGEKERGDTGLGRSVSLHSKPTVSCPLESRESLPVSCPVESRESLAVSSSLHSRESLAVSCPLESGESLADTVSLHSDSRQHKGN